MRVFVAIDLPKNLKEKISKIYRDVRGVRGKFVEPENLHITLKFLGEQPPHIVNEISRSLSEISYKSFKISVSGIGTFNNRVVWLGISDGFESTLEPHSLIDEKLKKIGFEKDKNFHPHITILRVKQILDKGAFTNFLENYSKKHIGSFVAKEFKLKRSILTPQGPIYEDIKVFNLE